MLSVPPYNTWPLRIKIYSKEVARLWEKLAGNSSSLPKGVEVSHEMEGVDGKSGLVGSGRTGPIDVTDRECFPIPNTRLIHNNVIAGEFTAEHLEKYKLLTSSSPTTNCDCCGDKINFDGIVRFLIFMVEAQTEVSFNLGSPSDYTVHSRGMYLRLSFTLHCTQVSAGLRTPFSSSLHSPSSPKPEFIAPQDPNEKYDSTGRSMP